MINKFIKISFYSTITFCVVSFLSMIISMLISKLNNSFPNFSIGFPFKYYYQFLVDSNDLQHGFQNGIIENFLIFWIIVFVYFQLKKIYYNYFSVKLKQKNQIN